MGVYKDEFFLPELLTLYLPPIGNIMAILACNKHKEDEYTEPLKMVKLCSLISIILFAVGLGCIVAGLICMYTLILFLVGYILLIVGYLCLVAGMVVSAVVGIVFLPKLLASEAASEEGGSDGELEAARAGVDLGWLLNGFIPFIGELMLWLGSKKNTSKPELTKTVTLISMITWVFFILLMVSYVVTIVTWGLGWFLIVICAIGYYICKLALLFFGLKAKMALWGAAGAPAGAVSPGGDEGGAASAPTVKTIDC